MLNELENPSVVDPQPFPHAIAALDDRIKRTDPRLVPMNHLAVDVDEQVFVFLVELLEHVQRHLSWKESGNSKRLAEYATAAKLATDEPFGQRSSKPDEFRRADSFAGASEWRPF